MSETAKITSKNQVNSPANMRKSLGVGTGDKIEFIRNAEIEAWIKEARQAMATDSSHAGD